MIDKFKGENAFLSNFFPATLTWDGQVWPSSEHAFQAAKTFNPEERARIAALDTPAKAKKAGKRVTLRSDWDSAKIDVMLDIVEAKFRQNPDLMEKLVATGDEELVEGNHWNDTFWGVCKGVGKNFLGKILMIVRDEEIAKRN